VSSHAPRVRLFAGPNGSGKSAIKERVLQVLGARQLGTYLNPDEIEKDWRRQGHVDFSRWNLELDRSSALEFLDRHPLMALRGGPRASEILRFEGSHLGIDGDIDSYLTSALVDHLRHLLLEDGRDMSFESVMSHPDKVAFLETSRAQGCRTYLYYVATEDPEINVRRVQERVRLGGHPVPPDKIRSRYGKSLSLMLPALHASDRAYIFDNSGDSVRWIAEVEDGKLQIVDGVVPRWFARLVAGQIPGFGSVEE